MLQKAQFFAVCGEERMFSNTEEALQHARHGSRLVMIINIIIIMYNLMLFHQHPYVSGFSSLKALLSEKDCNQKQVLWVCVVSEIMAYMYMYVYWRAP